MVKMSRATETQVVHILDRLKEENDLAHEFAANKWAFEVRRLNRKSSKNGFATQVLGVARLVFTVPLPLFAGLGLTGGKGATAVRWITFGLSFSAALIAAYIGIRGFEPRWKLYHTYADRLLSEGWLYLEKAGPYTLISQAQEAAAALFAETVCDTLEAMNTAYGAIVDASVSAGRRFDA